MKTPFYPYARRLSAMVATTLLALAGCSDPVGPEVDPDLCSTEAVGDGFIELCAPTGGAVHHVRIENLRAPATHASTQIVFGFDAPPTSAQGAIGEGQFRVLFYGGGSPAPAALVQASYGAIDAVLEGDASFMNEGGSVCFDLYDGSTVTAPAFILWVDGQKGANCANRSTLTIASAFAARTEWQGEVGSVNKAAKVYFRQSDSGGEVPRITLSTEPVLEESTISAALTCTTSPSADTNWQQLCAPDLGTTRHVRIESVESLANNSYFYAVLGEDPDPTGNPAPSAGKLILTGGRSHSGASWTWFRFGTGSTTQFSYMTSTASALYTQGASTICFDLGSGQSGGARFVFWATGANQADCSDRSSLTLDRALYDSTTDPSTSEIWDAPWISEKLNFVKTNNTNVSLGSVLVSSEPAAL